MTTQLEAGTGSSWDSWAARYDELFGPLPPEDPLIRFVVEMLAPAAGARVLEFGIGTGRAALPLSQQGLQVSGIDISAGMLERLREKDGAEAIELYEGDIATMEVRGEFDLVLCVFNTLYAVCSQAGQLATLRNAARHLRPGGHLILENASPLMMLRGFRFNQLLGFSEPDGAAPLTLMAGRLRPLEQLIRFHHIALSPDAGVSTLPSEHRYIWPAELDLMAQLAGFDLAERFGGWSKEPYDETSQVHVERYVRC
jgi:SAM-dependent methyltransferase